MNIELIRVNDAVHFEARNAAGNRAHVDGAKSVGGEGKGMRPMELMLASIAGCSAFPNAGFLHTDFIKLDSICPDLDRTCSQ